jgi:hypothetical protein
MATQTRVSEAWHMYSTRILEAAKVLAESLELAETLWDGDEEHPGEAAWAATQQAATYEYEEVAGDRVTTPGSAYEMYLHPVRPYKSLPLKIAREVLLKMFEYCEDAELIRAALPAGKLLADNVRNLIAKREKQEDLHSPPESEREEP